MTASRMQSSPPTRAWERPSSPAHSQYSLDLGALDVDSNSGRSTPPPHQHVDRILSEDIDGPSDFTLNMGKWMKGGTGKSTNRSKAVLQTLREQGIESPTGDSDDAQSLPESSHKGDVRTNSHHTPTGSPPRESVWRKSNHEEGDESEWDPYSEASTPKPPAHKELQPTVEDYYSEIMPTHFQFAQSLRSKNGRESKDGDGARASSPTLSPVIQRTNGSKDNLELELLRLQNRCLQLENLNNTLTQALKAEREKRSKEAAEHNTHAENAVRREKELLDTRDDATRRVQDFKRELERQKEASQSYRAESESESEQIRLLKEDHDIELQKLKTELEKLKAQHGRELRTLQQEHDLVRRNRDEAEETARALRSEMDEIELNRLSVGLDQNEMPPSGVRSSAERELVELRATQEREAKRAETEKQRNAEHTAELQQSIKDLRKQLFDEQVVHDAELLQMEEKHQQPNNSNSSELEDLRNDLEAKQSLLNDLTIDRDAAQDDLATTREELESIKSQLADVQAVSAAMDARISDAMRRREAYWRARLEKEEKERAVMAKALLHQWGREEVGIDAPQGYEFKYLDRKSKVDV